jgi:cytochrome P450
VSTRNGPSGWRPVRAKRDIDVDGYPVEAGTVAIVGIYAMHRDPALWNNPLVFDPDRFSPQNSRGRDRWQFLPFGGGPRSCIGDHFAMLEATLALATIIRRAEIPVSRRRLSPRGAGSPRSPAARSGPAYTLAVPRNDLSP